MKTTNGDKQLRNDLPAVDVEQPNIDTIDDETLIKLANSPFFQEKRRRATETLEKIFRLNEPISNCD
ncbi:hypothetical protein SAMN05216327_106213 [Dyadobacter sp. SG02]|uniref:hypothetical protein n=1 Tax=Dyadobacter sp. SG02 TaxID=1855291 RepID=UPI0008D54BBA|nr:hypothetical protein [Dyadobacter sp. SG02]SEJ12606.1 hypothetical protein SAMN05216327_106213 [Dyadobacter sp. SG02]